MSRERFNDPGRISREAIYGGLSKSEKSATVERTYREFCNPGSPSIVNAPKFLTSYDAFFVSYRTIDTLSYSDQFIFFFTPLIYTELSIICESLYNFIEYSKELSGTSLYELKGLEDSLESLLGKKDALRYTYLKKPHLLKRAPSFVFVFEQIYLGDPDAPQVYNFSGVFQGVYKELCYTI